MALRALDACLSKGIPACITAYGNDIAARLKQGFKFLAIANDTGLFTRAAQNKLAEAKEAISSAS